jgi:AraC family transcriptional regulator
MPNGDRPSTDPPQTFSPVPMFSAPGHRDTIWSDMKGSVARSTQIVWPGGTAATHKIDKVSGAAEIRTRCLELQFSWNSGYVEADADRGKQIYAYKNRPCYGLLLPPETGVEFRITEKSNYRFLSIELEPSYALRISELQHLSSVEFIESWDYNHPLTWQLARVISEECESEARAGLLYCETAVALLALHVTRHLSNYSRALVTTHCGGLAPGVLRRVCEYMTSRLEDDLSLSEIADISGLSPGHFSFAFKRSVGLSPHAWLRRERIDRAKALLRDRSLSLPFIASAVGFSTQSAFGVAFKRETGSTPTAWRRAHWL